MRIPVQTIRIRTLYRLAIYALILTCSLLACRLSEEGDLKTTISFNDLYDSLKQYDSVVITLKDPEDGRTIDVVFQGKVLVPGDLEKRPTPHWDGGKVLVSIEGFDAQGRVVYRMESMFDGQSNQRDSAKVFVLPGIVLGFPQGQLDLIEGDSLPLPAISIIPGNLADKRLAWSSADPDVVGIGIGSLRALMEGNTQVTARLVADTSKSLAIRTKVFARAVVPGEISLAVDTLFLSAHGPSGRIAVSVVPSTAVPDVQWGIDDPATAAVTTAGMVSGLKPGGTWLRVQSALRPSLKDSAWVAVSEPVPPVRVAFSKDSAGLYIGGAAESLVVAVYPAMANQQVALTASPSTVLRLDKGRLTGLAEGDGIVIACAKELPALCDTLKVSVSPGQGIGSVELSKKAITLYTGGEEYALAAFIRPAGAVQEVQWRSGNFAIASVTEAGKVAGVAPGRTRIYAISQADSTRQDSADVSVKTDIPVLSVGHPDTSVALGATVAILPVVERQEYGVVTGFKWDIDGIAGWDDSAGNIKSLDVKFEQEKEYTLRFYVRDTEGNEVIANKKVKAVSGSVVNILSPVNGAYVNKAAIKIIWTIDGAPQPTGTDTVLKVGANVITRSAKDGTGRMSQAIITVYLDSVPPGKPQVRLGSVTASAQPTWTWASGGGGTGIYRVSLDSESFAGSEFKDTAFTPLAPLSEGSHNLAVQERDAAGNWSASGKGSFTVDLSGPAKPVVKVNVSSPTNIKRPRWSWSSGGNGGSGRFQYRLGNTDFPAGASTLFDTTFTPASDLGDGNYTLYVRECDSIGNWSQPGSASITIDTSRPAAPTVYGATPTNVPPRWNWASGAGGSGNFRFTVGGDPAGAPETRDTAYTQPTPITQPAYSLSIQERDAAGNWSPVTTYVIEYDVTKPMVAFTAPQISGTYLTPNATVDLAGTASSPQGSANAIRNVSYSVDGTPGALATNFADGKWIIKALPLANNKTSAVKVVATDAAGNQGEATLLILRDDSAPTAPAFSAQPPTVVNKADARTSLQWAWSRTGEATDSFVVKLNGVEAARQTGTSYTVNTPSDGTYRVEVAEKDLTGNVSPFSTANSVLVDRIAPDAPVIMTSATSTRNSKPAWSWGAGGGGPFEYRLANGTDPTGAGTALAGTTYTPSAALADGAWYFQAREKDGAGNWSSWSASGVVVVKASAPAAPSVLRNASLTNAPKWTWTPGGGGNGTYRYRWSGNPAYLGEGASTEYAPNLVDGSYNLCVSERDTVGYGAEACASLAVDKTAPVISKLLPAEGFITNKPSVSVTFEKDGSPSSFTCDLTDGTSKLCSQTVSDAAGNSVTVSRTIWYRSNVVFVKAGAAGDGSSWDGAFGDINSGLDALSGKVGPQEIWVTEGSYSGFTISRSNTSIFGGFPAKGYPSNYSIRNLDLNISRIRPDSNKQTIVIGFVSDEVVTIANPLVDGFQVFDDTAQAISVSYADNAVFRNFRIERVKNIAAGAGVVAIHTRGDAVFEKVVMRDNITNYATLNLYSGGRASLLNSEISSNYTTGMWGSSGILNEYGGSMKIANSKFFKNGGGSGSYQIFIYGGVASVEITGCTIEGGRQGVYPTPDLPDASSIIWGTGNVSY